MGFRLAISVMGDGEIYMNKYNWLTLIVGLLLTNLPVFAQKSKIQKPPFFILHQLDEPIVFAEGRIKTTNGIAFSPDGKTLYTSQFIDEKDWRGRPRSRIFETKFINGNWSQPQPVSFSSKFSDYQPVLSPDGKRLFFNSSRPRPNQAEEERKINIWSVERTQNGWSESRYIEELNTDSHDGYMSVTRDGTIYFASDRSGGIGGQDIYRAKFRRGRYEKVEIVRALNTEGSENDLFIDPKERFIVFNRSFTGSQEVDLWISFATKGSWTEPRKLDKVNSPKRDLSPMVSPDGKYFFYMVQSTIYQIDLAALIYQNEPYFKGRLKRLGAKSK